MKSRMVMSLAAALALASPALDAKAGGGAGRGGAGIVGVGVGLAPMGLVPTPPASDAWAPLPGSRQQSTAEAELRTCKNEAREDTAIEKCMAARGYRRVN